MPDHACFKGPPLCNAQTFCLALQQLGMTGIPRVDLTRDRYRERNLLGYGLRPGNLTGIEKTGIQSHLVNPVTCVQPFSVRIKERTGLNSSL